jgi:hypothetical protein
MNERIRELAREAREYATTRHPVSNITLSVNSDLFEQKFARLIVQECIWAFGETRTEPSLERYILDRLDINNESR